jgi:hypothetical protein
MRGVLTRSNGDEEFCRRRKAIVAKPWRKCMEGCDFGEVSFVAMVTSGLGAGGVVWCAERN